VLRRDTWPQKQMEIAGLPREVVALQKLLVERIGRHDSFQAGTVPEPGRWEDALLEERRIAGVQLRESGIELTHIQAQNTDLRQYLEKAEHELDFLRGRTSDLEQELEPLREHLLDSEIELTRIRAQDADLQRQCERIQAANAELQRRCESLSRYDELSNRLERLSPSRIYRALRNRIRV
jgi:chromosome segregation ATPase